MKNIFSSDGQLANHLDGYEPRHDQVRMALAIEALISAPEQGEPGFPGYAKILLVEAETGIGKSLAYLIPVIVSGRKVVVSTATINLQDQLIDKEIPLLEAVFGEKIAAICVKGRQNYLCHYRWYQFRSSPQLSLIDDDQGDKIEAWLEKTETGDRAELDWLPDRSSLWPKISAHSHQCLGGECPESSLCFINRLRKKAGQARIIIVNHHLYFSDLALRQNGYGELLPRHEVAVFDEAHHLENVATSFFGKSVSQYQLYDLIGDIDLQAESDLPPDSADKMISASSGLKKRVEYFSSLFPSKRGRFNLGEFVRGMDTWSEEVQLLIDGLKRMSEMLSSRSGLSESWRLLEERTDQLCQSLQFVGLPDLENPSDTYVYWYERRERAITLSATPVNVADDLQRTLYSQVPSCVLTSATLSSGDRFDYICQRLGLVEKDIEILQLKSPFNYREQTLFYIPENQFPGPTDSGYEEAICKRIELLLAITRGRSLVLFTSFRGLDNVAEYLQEKTTYPVLVQGSASRSRLLKLFREQTDSVLLAVASFWEGVDIPGESLSAVIIDKLPFEVPSDPVVQARMQALTNNGKNPFFDFQVPRAVLTLRQGVGRLMRSIHDCGLISVLDVRLFSKGYGKVFMRSMPPSPVVRELEEVERFFAQLEKDAQ